MVVFLEWVQRVGGAGKSESRTGMETTTRDANAGKTLDLTTESIEMAAPGHNDRLAANYKALWLMPNRQVGV
jgi:hypothetical protein